MKKTTISQRTVFYVVFCVLGVAAFVAYGICSRVFRFPENDTFRNAMMITGAVGIFTTFLIALTETISSFINKDASLYALASALFLLGAFFNSSDSVDLLFSLSGESAFLRLGFHLASLSMMLFSLLLSALLLKRDFHRPISIWERSLYVLVFILNIALCFLETFAPSDTTFWAHVVLIGLTLLYSYLAFIWYLPYVMENQFTFKMVVLNTIGISMGMLGEVISFHYGSGYGLSFLAMISIDICFILIYLHFVERTTKKGYEEEKKAKCLEASLLSYQISPHYIFNALATVRDQYGQGTAEGNRAIELLSKTLRAYVSGGAALLIPFETEMKNVMSYGDFENLKTEYPVEIVCNIETTDFVVPALAVLTLVENAFRHSGITGMKDGYVEVETFEDESGIHLIVKDNGQGFDADRIPFGTGLKNTTDRFEILLQAKTEVHSSAMGTEIAIHIPLSQKMGSKK